jgi:hypothetical protein
MRKFMEGRATCHVSYAGSYCWAWDVKDLGHGVIDIPSNQARAPLFSRCRLLERLTHLGLKPSRKRLRVLMGIPLTARVSFRKAFLLIKSCLGVLR